MQNFYLRLYTVALLVLILNIAPSCSDDDDGVNSVDLLVGKNWYVIRYEEEDDGKVIDRTTAFLEDCEKDNYLFFDKTGTFQASSGAVQCADNGGDNINGGGTWSVKDSKILSMVWPITTVDQEIVSLSKSELKVKYEIVNGPNPTDKGYTIVTYSTRD